MKRRIFDGSGVDTVGRLADNGGCYESNVRSFAFSGRKPVNECPRPSLGSPQGPSRFIRADSRLGRGYSNQGGKP